MFVLYLCRPRYQVSVNRTIGPLVLMTLLLCFFETVPYGKDGI